MSHELIVFSHLRWDFVHQRPQHLLTRLASRFPVYFFEEPMRTRARPYIEVREPAPGVRVCRPHTREDAPGFHDDHIPTLRDLLDTLVEGYGLDDTILWFYTPMALPLVQRLRPRAIVYDCMDELSAFLGAPKQLRQRESALLEVADLVFTGGPSLHRSKREYHPSVHCFPSSVDREHYATALDPANEHPGQAHLPHPRLGYFGVIDERIDLDLVSALATAHPDWSISMVGPVVKIREGDLPRHPNLHYFGQRGYEELPRFVAGWDLCLLPFALNEATRFISPTKTLEYMAAERPIVSTPIADVVEPYGKIVLAAHGKEFVAACERGLALPPAELERRREAMRTVVAGTSWNSTAHAMAELIDEVVARNAREARLPALRAFAGSDAVAAAGVAIAAPVRKYDQVVLGAGPTGLSAAYHLGEGSLLIERNATVGGGCRSVQEGGYTFDYAGHIMFSNDPYVHELYRELLGDNVHWQDREAWIYSKEVYTRYPFQGALHGLPVDVLKECLLGAIEARFGKAGSAKEAGSGVDAVGGRTVAASDGTVKDLRGPADAATSKSCLKDGELTDCCADGTIDPDLTSTRALADSRAAPSTSANPSPPSNFEEFIYETWGAGVARHFAIPYNRKLWTVPLSEMETSWLGGRVPLPDLEEMIDGALRPVPKPAGPNARFGYPLRGGFQALMDGFLPRLECDLVLGCGAIGIDVHRREVTLADGRRFRYRNLISTIPLPELMRVIGEAAPGEVRRAAARLRYVSVRCVNLGVARPDVTEKHWIYYPEDTVFHRIFVQGNASPHCNRPGGSGLTCEITYSPSKPLPCNGEELVDLCIEDCVRVGLLRPDDRVEVRNQVDIPYAYVIYDHGRKRNVDLVRDWLEGVGILLAGRYSEWEYYNSDHAFLAGRKAADLARGAGIPVTSVESDALAAAADA